MANPNRESNVGNKGKTGNVNEREGMQGQKGGMQGQQGGQRNVGGQQGMGGQSTGGTSGGYSSQNVGQQKGMGGSQMGGNVGGMRQGWDQFRGRLREKWNTLQEQDLDRVGRNRDQLIGHINERAGGNRQEIERDIDRISRETGYRFE